VLGEVLDPEFPGGGTAGATILAVAGGAVFDEQLPDLRRRGGVGGLKPGEGEAGENDEK
jgi:hypothetical protein